nr:hypothetical protein GCM10025732_06110 [Glycomyces mayteni]
MYALQFVATVLVATTGLFLLHLLLFCALGWLFSILIEVIDERWARCLAERGPLVTAKYMFRAARMEQNRGGRGLKTVSALIHNAFGIPFLLLSSLAVAGAGVYLVLFAVGSYTDTSPLSGDLGSFALLLCLFAVDLWSPLGFMRPFKWMYSDRRAWYFWAPPLPLPAAHIDAQSRFQAAKAVYRLHLFSRVGLLSAALAAFLVATEVLLSPGPARENERAFLMLLLGIATSAGCVWAFDRVLRSRVRRWYALDRVSEFLASLPDKRAKHPAADASGKRRRALQSVAVAAERQARHLQAGAGPGWSTRPRCCCG